MKVTQILVITDDGGVKMVIPTTEIFKLAESIFND